MPRRPPLRALRKELLLKQQARCHYCKCPLLPPHQTDPRSAVKEHRTPLSRGGDNQHINIVLACRRCDMLKGRMTEAEFLHAIECVGSAEAYEQAVKWAALLNSIAKSKRQDERRARFLNPELYP